MNLIFKALEKFKKESALAPLLKMIEALLDLFVPLVMADIIDIGIADGNRTYIWQHAGILILLGAAGLFVSILAQYMAARAAVGASTEIRHELFAHIGELGYGELDRVGTGTLITRMTSDINQVQNAINLGLRLFLRSPFIVAGAAVMAFRVSARAGVIFLIVIPILAVIIFSVMKVTRPRYRKTQDQLDHITGITHENLTGVRVVRAFGRSADETRDFLRENEKLDRMQQKVGAISALLNPLTMAVINLAIVAILNTGAVQVNTGSLSAGGVIALINYMNQILLELVKFANLIVQTSRGLACADRVDSILKLKPAMVYGTEKINPDTDAPAVEFDHVSLRYGGSGEEALSDATFSVKRGETIGIIGGTGSAKSTVVNLIPRYYDATEGTVKVFGKNVKDYAREELRDAVGMVAQKAQLFSGTIRTNLLWGNEHASDEQLWRALDTAQASEFVREKEGGLDAPVEQGGRNFSGGQRQRLTIARTLAGSPEILILDDSSSALDYATDAALRKAIRNLSGTMTTFIVSQRTNSIMNADRIIVLDDGRIAGIGTHRELLRTCGVYRDIYDSQYGSGETPPDEPDEEDET